VVGRSTSSLELIVTYWKQLWRVELVVAICLLLYAAALTGLLRAGAVVFASAPPTTDGMAVVFALIVWFGVVPAIVLFGPMYALLRTKSHVNYPIAVAVALVSSIALVAVVRMGAIALYAIPSSIIVAVGVHAVMKRIR
jgi:hypothetical protein